MTDSEKPMATVICKLVAGKQASFLRELDNFASANRFAIRTAPTTPTGQDYLSQLWREDFKILVVNPFSADEFHAHVYSNDSITPPQHHADETAQKLIDAMQGVASCAIHLPAN